LTEAAAETIEVSAAVILRRTLCKRLRDADAVLTDCHLDATNRARATTIVNSDHQTADRTAME
jgi:hypothetical protein